MEKTQKQVKGFKPHADEALENERHAILFKTPQSKFLDLVEQEKTLFAESRNLFDFEELVNASTTPRKLVLPELGFFVTYCPLTGKERNEISKNKHHDKAIEQDVRNRKAVVLMIKKANPEVQGIEEKVENLPG
jgi:hypothetical protein